MLLFTLVMCVHGYAILVTKKLVRTSAVQINYHLGLGLILASATFIPYAFANPDYHVPSLQEFGLCFLVTGLPLGVGQLIFISALLMTKKYGVVTPFQFTNIVVGYLLSIFRYGEPVNPLCLVGAVAIVLGVVCIVRSKEAK